MSTPRQPDPAREVEVVDLVGALRASVEAAKMRREAPTTKHRLYVDDFPVSYRRKMILAYPVIAGMTQEQEWWATPAEKGAAFQRILDARNLRRTHELYLGVKPS